MATVIPDLFDRIVDANGLPVAGAKMYWYLAGTTTVTTVYQDNATSVAHANPIIADAGGMLPAIYAKDGTYKVVLTDGNGVALYTLDNYSIATAGVGGTQVSAPVVLKTSNYTVQSTDRNVVLVVDASAAPGQNVVITADSSALGNGFPFTVVNFGTAGTVTIVGVSAQLINQATSLTLIAQNQAADFSSNGATGWVVISSTAGVFLNAVTFYAQASFNSKIQVNAQFSIKEQTITWVSSPSSTTFDPSLGPDAFLTLAGAAMIMGPIANQAANIGSRGQIRILQDATGGRTITWDSTFVMSDGSSPTIGTQPSEETVFTYWIKATSGAGSVILTRRTGYSLVQRASVSTASGTSVSWLNIPAWAKRISVIFSGVTTAAASPVVTLGSGSMQITGYNAGAGTMFTGGSAQSGTWGSGFNTYSNIINGKMTLDNIQGTNTWVASGSFGTSSSSAAANANGGTVTISGVVDRVGINSGGSTFTGGVASITYEG